MCGILALLGDQLIDSDAIKELLHFIDQRGPDYSSPVREQITKCGLKLFVKSSVLHLRGIVLQEQPVIDEEGNVLMFNGQVYKFSGQPIDQEISDTTFLAERLRSCANKEEVANVFAAVNGPFAFIYWHNKLDCLFYGRDIFGRKSLCLLKDRQQSYPIVLSSVSVQRLASQNLTWTELDCKMLNCIDFRSIKSPSQTLFGWNLDEIYPRTAKCQPVSIHQAEEHVILNYRPLTPLNPDLRLAGEFSQAEWDLAIHKLEEKLLKSVSTRVRYNRKTCLRCRQQEFRDAEKTCDHSKIAVAFSGGIDSTLLALALDKIIESNETIDLVTVAFKSNSPDRISVGHAFKEIKNLCPNRKWCLVLCDISLLELQNERKTQIIDLILPCNTVLDDGLGCACWFIGRAKGRALTSQVGDDWLEAHFESFLQYNPSYSNEIKDHYIAEDYISPASMFFVGSSIDEQLGGYSSHKACWRKSGTRGVFEEISFLMRRLSTRNLGRDDRVYSHHGRDLKLPYLDFDFVSYLNQLPVGLKMNLDEPVEIGPKKLLRELAFRWGLQETSRRVKKALQFGSRIANLENSQEKGDDLCSRFKMVT